MQFSLLFIHLFILFLTSLSCFDVCSCRNKEGEAWEGEEDVAALLSSLGEGGKDILSMAVAASVR
jgi:hypothetical protein